MTKVDIERRLSKIEITHGDSGVMLFDSQEEYQEFSRAGGKANVVIIDDIGRQEDKK